MENYTSSIFSIPEPDILKNGNILLGQTLLEGRPVIMDEDSLNRHTLIVGSTGSGKTELLLGMSESSILSGGGVIFIDGKGDLSTWAKLYSIAKSAGREEDMLIINFSKGETNTWSPFDSLSAEEISSMLISSVSLTSHDVMWQVRATSLMRTVCMMAYDLNKKVNPNHIRHYMILSNLIKEKDNPLLSEVSKNSLAGYLESLPGYKDGKEITATTGDQHGYLSMQWTGILGLFCDTYKNVFKEESEVSLPDVIRNRRIIYIVLPALGKSKEDVSLLASLVINGVRTSMLDIMPDKSSGEWKDVSEGKTSSGLPPILCIMDEVGHYITPGMGIMASQSRSLGISLVFATQDIESMFISDKRETAMIISNVGTRILMRQVSPDNPNIIKLMPLDEGNFIREFIKTETLSKLSKVTNELNLAGCNISAFMMAGRSDDAINVVENLQKPLIKKLIEIKKEEDQLRASCPPWNLREVLKSLGSGEFIAIQGNKFLICRAIYISKGIEKVAIKINRFSALNPDKHNISFYISPHYLKNLENLLDDKLTLEDYIVPNEENIYKNSMNNLEYFKDLVK